MSRAGIRFLLAVTALCSSSAPSVGREASALRRTPVVGAVEAALPSVVNISTEAVIRVSDPFALEFERFFALQADRLAEASSVGSGVIVDSHGLILTNYHVVQRASNVRVRLLDGRQYPAAPVAYNVDNDLCLLQLTGDLSGESLVAIAFALPDDLLLGETVVAVGNPFGLENSVSTGVLSARNRSYREGGVAFDDVLQTDAAINPGNSGGPLVNLDGELIGMNVSIRKDAEGIGFAIPLRRIEAVLAAWLTPPRFSSGYCGFGFETAMTAAGPTVRVAQVWDGSPAAKAGLRTGDLITAVNREQTMRALDVGRCLWRLTTGDVARVERADGVALEVAVEEMSPEVLVRQRLGIRVQPLTQGLRRALGLAESIQGLVITDVFPDSEFATRRVRWGDMVRRGDIIAQAAGLETQSIGALGRALEGTRSGSRIPLVLIAVDTLSNRVQSSYIRIDVTLN